MGLATVSVAGTGQVERFLKLRRSTKVKRYMLQ